MDDATAQEANAWLAKARRDLDSARRLLSDTPPYRDTAAYHCQQAAEKAIKAVLCARGTPFPRSHDLTMLVSLAADALSDVHRLADGAATLTPYATLYRYPDAVMEPDDADVAEAMAMAYAFLRAAQDYIGREA